MFFSFQHAGCGITSLTGSSIQKSSPSHEVTFTPSIPPSIPQSNTFCLSLDPIDESQHQSPSHPSLDVPITLTPNVPTLP